MAAIKWPRAREPAHAIEIIMKNRGKVLREQLRMGNNKNKKDLRNNHRHVYKYHAGKVKNRVKELNQKLTLKGAG